MAANPRRVKVEFYGILPPDNVIVSADNAEIGPALMRAFGFAGIEHLTIVQPDALDRVEAALRGAMAL